MTQRDSARPKAVLELFEKGKVFTEELLKENENLRMVIARLKTEIRFISKPNLLEITFFYS